MRPGPRTRRVAQRARRLFASAGKGVDAFDRLTEAAEAVHRLLVEGQAIADEMIAAAGRFYRALARAEKAWEAGTEEQPIRLHLRLNHEADQVMARYENAKARCERACAALTQLSEKQNG